MTDRQKPPERTPIDRIPRPGAVMLTKLNPKTKEPLWQSITGYILQDVEKGQAFHLMDDEKGTNHKANSRPVIGIMDMDGGTYEITTGTEDDPSLYRLIVVPPLDPAANITSRIEPNRQSFGDRLKKGGELPDGIPEGCVEINEIEGTHRVTVCKIFPEKGTPSTGSIMNVAKDRAPVFAKKGSDGITSLKPVARVFKLNDTTYYWIAKHGSVYELKILKE